MSRIQVHFLSIFVILLVTLAGCGGGDSGETARLSVSPQATAVLVAADQVDGTSDKIVTKCAGCALHMDGMQEHALQVGDYEMHFCSADCKSGFADKTEEALLSMEMPEE